MLIAPCSVREGGYYQYRDPHFYLSFIMKTKEEIIHSMALTYRHDFGLRKLPGDPSWTAGMTEEDAKMLYKTMEQIYNNNIEPLLKEFNDLKEGRSVQIPQNKEHAALMYKLAQMYLEENHAPK